MLRCDISRMRMLPTTCTLWSWSRVPIVLEVTTPTSSSTPPCIELIISSKSTLIASKVLRV